PPMKNNQSARRPIEGTPVRELRHSRRLEIVKGSKPNSPAGIGRTRSRGHSRRAVWSSPSPHSSPLPWGEGQPCSPRSTVQSLRLSLRGARCSLSLRERVRVRGNGRELPARTSDHSRNVEPDESSGETGGSPNDNEQELTSLRARRRRVPEK